MDTEERTSYFKAYNQSRPNLVVRLGSAQTKEALRLLATAAGQTLSGLMLDGLVHRLIEEEMSNVPNLD
jgi:hypothetical protein